MKVRSTKKLTYQAGREGTKTAIIEIESKEIARDTVNKTISINATDYAIMDETTSSTSTPMYPAMNGKMHIASETKTMSYDEYDAKVDIFKALDTSELVGSELEDAIQQTILLDTVSKGKLYSSAVADWVKYSDPIPVP